MKKTVGFILIILFATLPSPSGIHPLSEVMNPDSMLVSADRIYITEGATIYIYNKETMKYIGKFGKKGEGPGEISTSRRGGVSFTLFPVNSRLFIHNRSKVMFFEKDGKFISEKKLESGFIRDLTPVGDHYVARSFKMGENRSRTESLTLYGADFNKIRELPGKKDVEFSRGGFFKIYSDTAIFTLRTRSDTIFIHNSKDFLIERYRGDGTPLSPIRMDYPSRKVSSEKKSEIRNYFKNSPRFRDFWERIKDMFDIADEYPAIRNFIVSGKKIYIQTYQRTGKGDEFYILDIQGKLLNKTYLPVSPMNIMEDHPYAIEGEKFYTLMENEDEEEWEIRISDI